MDASSDTVTVTAEDNETGGRIVAHLEGQDGEAGELTFRFRGSHVLVADHTGVPTRFGGRGIGTRLVEGLVDYARDSGRRIDPQCPFVKDKLVDRRDWHDVLDE